MSNQLLVINPGSTSIKIAVFLDSKSILEEKILHPKEDLESFSAIWDQLEYRYQAVLSFLKTNNLSSKDFNAIVARGGMFKPMAGGTYKVNQAMMEDARTGPVGIHPGNLACVIAHRLATQAGISAYVVDPISVDEFEPLARYSGHPLIERRCLSHSLNLHATGRKAAAQLNIPFEKSRFILAHLGGGISVCPLKNGRMIDVNDASSDGPFSPERTGGLPLQQFISLCYSGNYSENEMRKLVMGKGGLLAYLNTYDAKKIEDLINQGDQATREIYEAMSYQIAKEIGAMSTVLSGKIDAIVLCGALAHSRMLTQWIINRVNFIAPIIKMPGEFEMQALTDGVLRVLSGTEEPLEYR